jgi:hydroxymethylpyrimidine/phosphomethylpyrimidine kinase
LETLPDDEAPNETDGIAAPRITTAGTGSRFSSSIQSSLAKGSGLASTRTQNAAQTDVAEMSIKNLVLEDDDIVDDYD